MNPLSEQLRSRVLALRPQWQAAGISGFLYLEGGYSNHNYRFSYEGERYVLRAPFRERPFVDRELERRVYACAEVGAPEVLALDVTSGAMISRWVDGALLADRSADGAALTRHLRRLHGALPAVERRYDPVAQARAHLEEGASAPAWLERLVHTTFWSPPEVCTCHNDLNPWNVMQRPNGDWVTLDWEWVGGNDPLFDLVTLHQGMALDEEELAPLAADLLGRPVAEGRLRSCLVGFWLRETTWALAEIEAGNDRPEVVAQRDLGLERLRALN